MRIAPGYVALVFGIAALWVALAGLLYVLQIIAGATAVLIEIGAITHG